MGRQVTEGFFDLAIFLTSFRASLPSSQASKFEGGFRKAATIRYGIYRTSLIVQGLTQVFVAIGKTTSGTGSSIVPYLNTFSGSVSGNCICGSISIDHLNGPP